MRDSKNRWMDKDVNKITAEQYVFFRFWQELTEEYERLQLSGKNFILLFKRMGKRPEWFDLSSGEEGYDIDFAGFDPLMDPGNPTSVSCGSAPGEFAMNEPGTKTTVVNFSEDFIEINLLEPSVEEVGEMFLAYLEAESEEGVSTGSQMKAKTG